MFLFSQPPPFNISFTSTSSCSHCSKWMTGVSSPRLFPLFFPVIESTELGRSLPRRVASATASRIAWRRRIWLTPTGVCTKNVGIPVSWQIGPSSSTAMSTFDRMMSSACDACVPGVSSWAAIDIAARTSGGRFVDVCVISSRRLLARNSIGALEAPIVACSALFQLQPHIRAHPRLDCRNRAVELDDRLAVFDLLDHARHTRALQIQHQHQGLLSRMDSLQNVGPGLRHHL